MLISFFLVLAVWCCCYQIYCYCSSSILYTHPSSSSGGGGDSFVTANESTFYLGGRPFYFAGANCYDIFTYGSSSGDTESSYMNKTKIDEHFSTMAANGVSVVRTWGFNTQHTDWHPFEPTKGAYNQQQFDLFDYVVLSAESHGIKLIVTLDNYWKDYGGISLRLAWEGVELNESYPNMPNQGAFFENTAATQSYLDYVEHFITRANHYTNITYADTTTILAWELMNEPRHEGYGDNEASTVLRAWVDKVGARIKSIDPNHLLGTGLEGHGANYMGGDEGNNFLVIHSSPYIDFCSAHPYPTESWYNFSIPQTQDVIKKWIYDCQVTLNKPMLIGEFNVYKDNWSGSRSEWWSGIYQSIEEAGGAGDLFWWFQSAAVDQTYGVSAGDSELAVFKTHSKNMKNKNKI